MRSFTSSKSHFPDANQLLSITRPQTSRDAPEPLAHGMQDNNVSSKTENDCPTEDHSQVAIDMVSRGAAVRIRLDQLRKPGASRFFDASVAIAIKVPGESVRAGSAW